MGFEQVTPPVPDRLDQIKMIDRLQASWLSQPYNRYYMNQDVRTAKWNYNNYNLATRRKFLSNCLLVSFFTLPLAYWSRRFYIYNRFGSSGVPFVKQLTYFERSRTAEFQRSKAANKTCVLIWFISTAIVGTSITNWNYRSDENYDIFSKVDRML